MYFRFTTLLLPLAGILSLASAAPTAGDCTTAPERVSPHLENMKVVLQQAVDRVNTNSKRASASEFASNANDLLGVLNDVTGPSQAQFNRELVQGCSGQSSDTPLVNNLRSSMENVQNSASQNDLGGVLDGLLGDVGYLLWGVLGAVGGLLAGLGL